MGRRLAQRGPTRLGNIHGLGCPPAATLRALLRSAGLDRSRTRTATDAGAVGDRPRLRMSPREWALEVVIECLTTQKMRLLRAGGIGLLSTCRLSRSASRSRSSRGYPS